MSVQERVAQLVARHHSFTAVVAEVNGRTAASGGEEESKLRSRNSVESLVSYIRQEAMLAHGHVSNMAAAYCVGRIKHLLQGIDSRSTVLLKDTLLRESMRVLMAVMQQLTAEGSFNKSMFVKRLNTDVQHKLPLELLWLLHTHDVMTLDDYIASNLSRPAYIGRLAHDMVSLCCPQAHEDADSAQKRSTMLKGLMQYLLQQGYLEKVDSDNAASKGMKKVACALLDSITKKALQKGEEQDLSVYTGLTGGGWSQEDREAVRKYCTRQLTLILSHAPHLKVSDALMQQKDWTFARTRNQTTRTFLELLVVFSAEEALQILQRVLEQQEVNWATALSFTATMLVNYSEMPKLLTGLTRSLVSRAVESGEMEGLITAVLLARQASLEGPHISVSYQNWFQELFGDGVNSLANNRQTFTFLMKFLSSIVPYEDAGYLRTHISKPPYVPPKCRLMLTDYVTLAKTRLLDLNQPFDEQGIFESGATDAANTAEANPALKQAEGDVQKALTSFEKSGKLPASVMEASIFRKPYFVGRFLPALLKPRLLPEQADSRMRLIELLKRAEKIPASLFSQYEAECDRMTQQLLHEKVSSHLYIFYSRVFSDNDDDDMDELLLSPWQQLERCLDTLSQHLGSEEENGGQSFRAQISVLSDKVDILLPSKSPIEGCPPQRIDVYHVQPEATAMKIVVAVLEMFNNMFKQSSAHTLRLNCFRDVICVLTGKYLELLRAFHVKLLEIVDQNAKLEDHQIKAMSAVCHHLSLPGVTTTTVQLHIACSTSVQFLPFLLTKMQCCDSDAMLFCIRFCRYFLEFERNEKDGMESDNKESTEVYSFIIKRFIWLLGRFQFAVNHTSLLLSPQSRVVVMEILKSPLCATLVNESLKVEEWVELEIGVDQQADFMLSHLRLQYYKKVVYQQFLNVDNTPRSDSIVHVCTSLVKGIVGAKRR